MSKITGFPRAGWSPLGASHTWQEARETADRLVASAQPAHGSGDAHFWNLAGARYLAPLLFAAASTQRTLVDVVRWVARRAPELSGAVRAVIAPHIPAGVVALLAGTGILALRADPDAFRTLQSQTQLGLPAPSDWNGKNTISASAGYSIGGFSNPTE